MVVRSPDGLFAQINEGTDNYLLYAVDRHLRGKRHESFGLGDIHEQCGHHVIAMVAIGQQLNVAMSEQLFQRPTLEPGTEAAIPLIRL